MHFFFFFFFLDNKDGIFFFGGTSLSETGCSEVFVFVYPLQTILFRMRLFLYSALQSACYVPLSVVVSLKRSLRMRAGVERTLCRQRWQEELNEFEHVQSWSLQYFLNYVNTLKNCLSSYQGGYNERVRRALTPR